MERIPYYRWDEFIPNIGSCLDPGTYKDGRDGIKHKDFPDAFNFPMQRMGSLCRSFWKSDLILSHTVDGKNPANQLRLVVYPIIYKVLYIPGGWPWDF